MKKLVLAAALSIAFAAPAMANELSVEARAGDYVGQGYSNVTAGIAVGNDFDLSKVAFVGAQVAADKIMVTGTRVAFTTNARAGVNIDSNNRMYAFGGYSTMPCSTCVGGADAGAGVEHNFFGSVYGKVEYTYYMLKGVPNAYQFRTGVGIRY